MKPHKLRNVPPGRQSSAKNQVVEWLLLHHMIITRSNVYLTRAVIYYAEPLVPLVCTLTPSGWFDANSLRKLSQTRRHWQTEAQGQVWNSSPQPQFRPYSSKFGMTVLPICLLFIIVPVECAGEMSLKG